MLTALLIRYYLKLSCRLDMWSITSDARSRFNLICGILTSCACTDIFTTPIEFIWFWNMLLEALYTPNCKRPFALASSAPQRYSSRILAR